MNIVTSSGWKASPMQVTHMHFIRSPWLFSFTLGWREANQEWRVIPKDPAKHMQHFIETSCNIVGSCCEGVGQMHATSCYIQKCCNKNLTIFKLDSTLSNILQHVATGLPNLCNTLHATMLQDVALKCWVCLTGP